MSQSSLVGNDLNFCSIRPNTSYTAWSELLYATACGQVSERMRVNVSLDTQQMSLSMQSIVLVVITKKTNKCTRNTY